MDHRSESPKRFGGKKAAAMAASAMVAGSTLFGAAPAVAASNISDNYWGPEYGSGTQIDTSYFTQETTWIGAVATKGYTNGTDYDRGYTWCIQWSESANGAELRTPDGTSDITGDDARVANIIISKHAGDRNMHPEIALAMHELFDASPDDDAWAYEKRHNDDPKFNSILRTAQGWIEDAEQFTGPYTIDPDFDFEDEVVRPGDTGSITSLEVMSGGTSLGDGISTVGEEIELTVELEGNVEFTSGNEKVQTLEPGTTPEVVVTGAGPVSASVSTNEALPNSAVTKINFGSWQDRITRKAPEAIEGSTNVYQSKWDPSVQTQTSHPRAEPGTELFDKFEIEGVPTDEDVTVESTLYFAGDERPERQADIPEHAEAVGTVETVVNGPGEYETPTVTIDERGYYVWVETIEGTDEMDSWTSDYGINEEISIVPWEPTVTTQISEQRALAGSEIYDTLLVEGNKDGKELTVESTLYGPFDHREAEGTELPEDAPVVTTMSTEIVGNGEFQTEPVLLEETGYYFWTEEIAETDETEAWGDDEDESPTWQVQETTIIPWEIESSSEISDRSSHLGSTVFDTVWFDGFPWDHAVDRGELFLMAPPANQPDAEGQYKLPITEGGELLDETDTPEAQLTMYGPFETMPERSEEVPEDAPVHDTVMIPAVNGELVSADFKEFEDPGYYTIVTEFEGSERVEPYVSEFGIPSESTYVPHPEEPEAPPVPDEPAEPVKPDAPEGVKTPDEVRINSGNPEDAKNTGWALAAGAGIILAGLGGYLLYRRKSAATTEE